MIRWKSVGVALFISLFLSSCSIEDVLLKKEVEKETVNNIQDNVKVGDGLFNYIIKDRSGTMNLFIEKDKKINVDKSNYSILNKEIFDEIKKLNIGEKKNFEIHSNEIFSKNKKKNIMKKEDIEKNMKIVKEYEILYDKYIKKDNYEDNGKGYIEESGEKLYFIREIEENGEIKYEFGKGKRNLIVGKEFKDSLKGNISFIIEGKEEIESKDGKKENGYKISYIDENNFVGLVEIKDGLNKYIDGKVINLEKIDGDEYTFSTYIDPINDDIILEVIKVQ